MESPPPPPPPPPTMLRNRRCWDQSWACTLHQHHSSQQFKVRYGKTRHQIKVIAIAERVARALTSVIGGGVGFYNSISIFLSRGNAYSSHSSSVLTPETSSKSPTPPLASSPALSSSPALVLVMFQVHLAILFSQSAHLWFLLLDKC